MRLGALRTRRDEIQDHAFGFRAVWGAKDVDPVRFQRGCGSRHAVLLGRGRVFTTQCPVVLHFTHESGSASPTSTSWLSWPARAASCG